MIFTKKYVSIILALCLTASLCPAAFAAGAQTYSDKCLTFIEREENAQIMNQERIYAYEDSFNPGVWNIGYGSSCTEDQYPDGISQDEAVQLLKDYLDNTLVPGLNAYLTANAITVSQNQYDALVSLTYNIGSAWMNSGWRIDKYLKGQMPGSTDAGIVDIFGALAHVGSTPVAGLVERRIREAKVFLYGDYTGASSPKDFCWMIVSLNGGKYQNGENDIFCFEKGGAYGTLARPVFDGKYFAGWKNDATGAILRATDTVTGNVRATAVWSDVFVLPYTDVKSSDWFYSAVASCYKGGLMDGISSTTFAPNANMTRAMMVTVLWRIAGKPTANYVMPFTDVDADTWYTEAVRWAAASKIVTGTTDTTFTPNANVTREQMVAFMYRYAKTLGTVTGGAAMGLAGYTDVGDISSYAYGAFQWAVNNSIVQGSGGKLEPKSTATRAQVAQVIVNYTGK